MSGRRPGLAALVPSWHLDMRAARKSRETIKSYLTGVRQFLAYCDEAGVEAVLDRPTVNAWTTSLLDAGAEPGTVTARLLAVRRFSAWLAEEGELDLDVIANVHPPKRDTKVVQPLADDEIERLIKVCQGRDPRDRRDEAIVRFMLETGARAGEVVGMMLDDIDLARGLAVLRGKGGKERVVPFGPHTARAIDRHLRTRRAHPKSDGPWLWLAERRAGLTYQGLYQTLQYRAELAGLVGFHPHQTRHTAAHRWLKAGGSESGLMAVAGWSRPDMLVRYTRARAAERAADEARSLNLGDL